MHDELTISCKDIESVHSAFFGTNETMNYGQSIAVWLLNVLTKNLFPEVIGYPDPLHKADWGAKTVKHRVEGLIKSSEIVFRTRPRSRTLRQMRSKRGR